MEQPTVMEKASARAHVKRMLEGLIMGRAVDDTAYDAADELARKVMFTQLLAYAVAATRPAARARDLTPVAFMHDVLK